MKLLVTGGCGFIGSNLILYLMAHTDHQVLNVDKLTYAANPEALDSLADDPRYRFAEADIADAPAMTRLFSDFQPDAVLHLAAESNVDRSISSHDAFIHTNLTGTACLLACARDYWLEVRKGDAGAFGFYHVSTDEVFGDLGSDGAPFVENSPYAPSSPYSASKAGADHLVRAWHRTWGLPVTICHPTNNYGPWQLPDKLVPRIIHNAVNGRPIPVYGNGEQVRDWLHVDDHARALVALLAETPCGESFVVGSRSERTNLQVIDAVCDALDELLPVSGRTGLPAIRSYRDLVEHVTDRPGHDIRYAVEPGKIERATGWQANKPFSESMHQTVAWYLAHRDWCQRTLARLAI